MNIDQHSAVSQESSPARKSHALGAELIEEDLKWNDKSRSKDNSFDSENNDQYYITPNHQNQLQNEPELDLNSKGSELSIPEPESNPKTITLIEESLFSKSTVNMSSKISKFSGEVDNESYAAFLSMRSTNYEPIIKGFQVLFQNISNMFGDRAKHIEETYLTFLRIKCNQQRLYHCSKLSSTLNCKNQMINLDCKLVADQIHNRVEREKEKMGFYVQELQRICKTFEKQLAATKEKATQKQAQIQDIFKKITRIAEQMTSLMIPQSRKRSKHALDSKLLTISYVRTKYLMGKQRSYLTLMAKFLEGVTQYVSFICFEAEPSNYRAVKQSLASFAEVSCAFQPKLKMRLSSKIDAVESSNCEQNIFKEVLQMLSICIPETILQNITAHQKQTSCAQQLHWMMESLIGESQAMVYLPIIEIEGKDYAYHSKNKADITWRKFNNQQKNIENCFEQFEIDIIVTHEGYLILQILYENSDDNEMAVLKLKDIKISRKNNLLIITDKGKGMFGYLLSSNAVLGEFILDPIAPPEKDIQLAQSILIEELIDRVKQVIEIRSERRMPKN